ncbi:MAG: MoxR family ATPase [Chloroflexota bacterium]
MQVRRYTIRERPNSASIGDRFANLVLTDEINHATPSKIAERPAGSRMQRRQVTIGDVTYKMDDLFLVLATRNPITGKAPTPCRKRRWTLLLKVLVDYPQPRRRASDCGPDDRRCSAGIRPVVSPQRILQAREAGGQAGLCGPKIKDYVLDLVRVTRRPGKNGLSILQNLVSFGASPRASINLVLAARAYAFLQGRGFVTPDDVKQIAPDVLRHRIITSYEAEAENITSDHIVQRILDHTDVP